MKTREYDSAGGVIIDNGKMLLLERPSRGEVRLPKGHVEPGESPDETALREVQEESGVGGLQIIEDLGSEIVEFDYDGAHIRRTEHYFLMERVGEEIVDRPSKDAAQFAPVWVLLNDAVTRLTFPAEREAAQRAIMAYQSLGA